MEKTLKNVYVIYVNVNRGGWIKFSETPSRKSFEDALYCLIGSPDSIQVITKFRGEKGDYPLVCFWNKLQAQRFNLTTLLHNAYIYLPGSTPKAPVPAESTPKADDKAKRKDRFKMKRGR